MIIELKKVKVAKHLSEETLAFTAEIHVDGVLAAYASNHGTGGCNEYHFTASTFRDLLEDAAKKADPKSMEALDSLVGKLMEDDENRKAVAKFKKKGFNHVVKISTGKQMLGDEIYYTSAVLVAYTNPSQLEGILKENKAEKYVILTAPKVTTRPVHSVDAVKALDEGKASPVSYPEGTHIGEAK